MGPELTNDGLPDASHDANVDGVADGTATAVVDRGPDALVVGAPGRTEPDPMGLPPVADALHPHQRIPALDGLRGIAVLGVVLFHAGHLSGGFLGVDLFFVLSGYLITTVLLRSASPTGGIGLKRFWSRRARRLIPALVVVLVVVLPVYAHWFATPTDLDPVRWDGFGSVFYVTNWTQIIHGQSYFTNTLAESPLRHMWSLAVEEQFYLVWPLLVIASLKRGGVRTVFRVACVLGVASALLMIVLGATRAVSFNSLYLGTHTRAASVLAGAALASWFALHGRPTAVASTRKIQGVAIGAAVVLAVMWFSVHITSTFLYVGGMAISALCGTALVAACATSTDGLLVRALALPGLRHLGIISYGVYLWSWPIMQLVSERHTSLSGWSLLVVQMIVTIDIALASWFLIERPILRGWPSPPWSARLLVAGATAAVVAVVIATAAAIPVPSTKVSTGGYAMSSKEDAPKLLVVGDSLPARIAQEGIIPQRDALGISTVDRTVPGCILLRSVGPVKGIENNIREDVRPCNNHWGELAKRYDPDVVLVMFGEFPNDQVEIDGSFHLPCTPAYQREERKALNRAFDQLTAHGARVVISTVPGTSVFWVLDGVPAGMNQRVACMNDLYREVAEQHENVDVVDLAGLICPKGRKCKEQVDGINLRPDTLHFRGESAEYVARWLVAEILGTEPIDAPTKPSSQPANPLCKPLAKVLGDVATFSAAVPSGSTDSRRAKLVEPMRKLPAGFTEDPPLDVSADVAWVAEGWDDTLDRAASLPAEPTGTEVADALGDLVTPLRHLVSWSDVNCS